MCKRYLDHQHASNIIISHISLPVILSHGLFTLSHDTNSVNPSYTSEAVPIVLAHQTLQSHSSHSAVQTLQQVLWISSLQIRSIKSKWREREAKEKHQQLGAAATARKIVYPKG